ncbi:MAG: N-acetyltransferase [Planctomycetaceae bacterium]
MSPNRYKRYRMELDLRICDLPTAVLPDGYRWLNWQPLLAERHAQVNWRAFRNDLDGVVFPCLSDLEGCRRLMGNIADQSGFCRQATWIAAFQPEPAWPAVDCATIQGVGRSGGIGAIQNIGVIPEHRGNGLGRAVLLKAIEGFRQAGYSTVSLEVTARNSIAVSLYRSLGFRVTRVLYRAADGGGIISGTERKPVAAEAHLTTPGPVHALR